MDSPTINVKLDRERPVRWSHRALSRLQRIHPAIDFDDLAHPKHVFGAVHGFIWASLTEPSHPFENPEDIAEYLPPDKIGYSFDIISKLFGGEFDSEKKTTSETDGHSE